MLKRLLAPACALLMAALLSGCFLLPKEADPPELPLVTPFSGAEYTTAVVTRGDLVSAVAPPGGRTCVSACWAAATAPSM